MCWIVIGWSFSECDDIEGGSLNGLRHLCIGVILCNTGHAETGVEHYREAIQLGEDDDDIHIAAFASYELATILTKCPEVKLDLLYIPSDNRNKSW